MKHYKLLCNSISLGQKVNHYFKKLLIIKQSNRNPKHSTLK